MPALQEADTKKIGNRTHDRGDFLIVEDPDSISTWHLPVKVRGKPNRALAGAAWAALFSAGGFRGKKYSGPDPAGAKRKLKALYKAQDWDLPTTEAEVEEMLAELELELSEYEGYLYPDRYSWSATSFAQLDAEEEAAERVENVQERMAQLWMLFGNVLHSPEITDKSTALRSIFDEFLEVAGFALSGNEQPSEPMEEHAALLSLSELDSAELAELDVSSRSPRRLPVLVDFSIIKPGFGNKRDKRYYSEAVLSRDGQVFSGVDVFATNHLEEEKSERTKVGKVRSVRGLTESGLVGQFLIYDPDMAEKTRNRADAGELSTLECSIYATGMGREGTIEGREAFIVEQITSAASVDLVSKAGAGGHALSLSEMEGETNMTGKTKEPIVEGEQEEVQIEEQDAETPDAQADAQDEPETQADDVQDEQQTEGEEEAAESADLFTSEQIKDVLDETDLSPEAQTWIKRGTYASKEELDQAIAEMKALLLSQGGGAGRPFGLGESETAPNEQQSPAEIEEGKRVRFNEIMARVDPSYAQRI